MTADQLIHALFVDYWFLTTLATPTATFLYAWVTGQVWWCIGSFFWALCVANVQRFNRRNP